MTDPKKNTCVISYLDICATFSVYSDEIQPLDHRFSQAENIIKSPCCRRHVVAQVPAVIAATLKG